MNSNPTNATEQFKLGQKYSTGDSVPQNYEKSVYWYTKAAEQGHVDAQFELGGKYYYEHYGFEDYEKSVYWYTKAAEQGHVDAQIQLGKFWEYLGGEQYKNYKKAAYWYTKAAEQGHADTMFWLSTLYGLGKGVPRDEEKKRYWLKKAAEHGDERAQENLNKKGGCYVATCVYGSYNCPEVWILRRFRDGKLSSSFFGRQFIWIYYTVSPKIVILFGKKRWFNRLCKLILDKLVSKLQNSGN